MAESTDCSASISWGIVGAASLPLKPAGVKAEGIARSFEPEFTDCIVLRNQALRCFHI